MPLGWVGNGGRALSESKCLSTCKTFAKPKSRTFYIPFGRYLMLAGFNAMGNPFRARACQLPDLLGANASSRGRFRDAIGKREPFHQLKH